MQQYTILLSISRYILSYIAFPAFPYWTVTVAVLDRLYSYYKLVAKTLMKNAANCLLTWFELILLFFLILHGKV